MYIDYCIFIPDILLFHRSNMQSNSVCGVCGNKSKGFARTGTNGLPLIALDVGAHNVTALSMNEPLGLHDTYTTRRISWQLRNAFKTLPCNPPRGGSTMATKLPLLLREATSGICCPSTLRSGSALEFALAASKRPMTCDRQNRKREEHGPKK